ncbi:hypothetical protein HF313_23105 [Massilia atriviolacea]|uniref:DUF6484 domain-containing protein n=1 Tax=Massilia atriviolacea TaxID=2495579 RepID=A0A430HKJ2_9BURK|nr:DUF6484 domain-containing protein [Massilia atriviolacea]RSZ58067.1 hypothetical protein EJB06_17390 [Massilia atriviolacea]
MIVTNMPDLGTAATACAQENDHIAAATSPVTGLVIGTLAGWSNDGLPLVNFDGNPAQGPAPARAFAALTSADIGKMVALQFERGDLGQVAVMGVLHRSARQNEPASPLLLPPSALQVIENGDELRLVANRKLTLQCGRASITLDVDGSVEIRGQDLLSRAAGQNRIKGSSVSLN